MRQGLNGYVPADTYGWPWVAGLGKSFVYALRLRRGPGAAKSGGGK
ncbi:MAG: hypothetical protein ABSG53_13535 [Thermoguttaceae bacterium]